MISGSVSQGGIEMLYKDFDNSDLSIEYSRTSKGNQPKWKDGQYWFKQDMLGYEALAEVLISGLLAGSNMQDHVQYEPVKIRYNKKTLAGCCSRDFKKPGEELFTLERLHLAFTGELISDHFKRSESARKRIEYTAAFIEEHTGISGAGAILTKWLEADAFFLNEDRHTNNIAFVRNAKSGEWRFCPYYDNGLALLSDINDYPLTERISSIVSAVPAKPFAKHFDKQVDAARSLFGRQLVLSFNEEDVLNELEPLAELYDEKIIDRVASLIRVQTNRYRDLFA